MTATAEHLASIDAQLAAARAAWTDEKKLLEDRILALGIELDLHKQMLAKAVEARSNAERMSAKLVAQFGIVAQVFEDAKNLAIASGLYSETRDEPAVANQKALIDAVTSAVVTEPQPQHPSVQEGTIPPN